jgi:chemotaxis protein histidine kinase CheA
MIKEMQEILGEGGTSVYNTYAVEIGSALCCTIWDYLWDTYGHDDDYRPVYNLHGVYEDGDQKFIVVCDRELKYYRLNFSLSETEGFKPDEELIPVSQEFDPIATAQFSLEDNEQYYAQKKPKKNNEDEDKKETEEDNSNEDKKSEDNSDDNQSSEDDEDEDDDDEQKKKKEKKAKYNLEEIPEYVALQNDYAAATARIAELEQANNQLTATNTELVEFKKGIEIERKKELINSFYMLSDEDKKDCIDNIATYSYDDIEAKLSIICVRNRVSFNLDDDKQPGDAGVQTFNLGDLDNEDKDLPAWVQRVQEVAKDNNI